jgi:hypothetical protein
MSIAAFVVYCALMPGTRLLRNGRVVLRWSGSVRSKVCIHQPFGEDNLKVLENNAHPVCKVLNMLISFIVRNLHVNLIVAQSV